MADESGSAPGGLSTPRGEGAVSDAVAPPSARASAIQHLLDLVARAPYQFDFFQVLRRLEALHRDRPDRPRLGAALRPREEPIRLGHEPSLAFAPSTLAALRAGRAGAPPTLSVNFFGLLGPNGPLPLHLTEYARDRERNAADPTMARFLDLFHHRMLLFFYRAWAAGQPTVNHDQPDSDRFEVYVGALAGLALAALGDRDELPDSAKLFYVGRLAGQTHNAEGLAAMIGDFFALPARIQPFVGDWLDLPVEHRWRLGASTRSRLGVSTTLGARAWSAQQKFRVVLGPLTRGQFQRMLPGGVGLPRLRALVRNYTGDELRWDVRLILQDRVEQPWRLGQSNLTWTTWLGRALGARREDLILDPQTGTETETETQAAAS